MTVDFSDNFWGESPKNSGIDVLFQNLKYGVTTTKDVGDFLRERSSTEESHSRALGKLAKLASNGCSQGSFGPLWQFLKASSEKLATAHVQMAQKVEDLMKELSKYAEELQKKHKSVKDEESPTVEAVQQFQNSKAMVSKTKAIYMQRYSEFEKCQKDNVSQKDLEKAEIKMRKAHEEYKTWVDKYQTYTEDYLVKFSKACQRFQNLEEIYLKQMKDFLNNYATLMEHSHEAIGQVHAEFREMCSNLSIDELLLRFVTSKSTGKDRPNALDVDDIPTADAISQRSGSSEDKSSIDKAPIPTEKKREGNIDNDIRSRGSRRTSSLLNLFIPQSQQGIKTSSIQRTEILGLDLSSVLGQAKQNSVTTRSSVSKSSSARGSQWFLRGRKGKKKDKKSEQNGKDELEDKQESLKSPTSVEVDDEGYSVRPQNCGWEAEKNNFYSSTDDDSDDEPERRLHVEIKPLTNGTAPLSASVDELRTTMENITLSPMGYNGRRMPPETEGAMKRSQSVSQQIGNASPPSAHPYTPLSPPIVPVPSSSNQSQNPTASPASRYADLGDIFAEVGELQPSIFTSTTRTRNTPTPSGTALPRPSSRPRQDMLMHRNASTPSPIVSRTDSVSSIDARSIGQFGGSRGPSPLTLGLGDSIPLAVAFHEIIHAYFKGNDETKCQVKMTGDMMVSFPAGIIQNFASNPSPAQLKFKVRTKQPLESIDTKSELVKIDRIGDELWFEFSMSALTNLLKKHAEQNPTASYFNIDVFKYKIKPKTGVSSCPLHLVAFWKCEPNQTDLRIDYKYNSHATEQPSASPLLSPNLTDGISPLTQVCIAAPVDGGVKGFQSKPSGQWFPSSNRFCWKIQSLSTSSENLGVGSLRARFEVDNGPTTSGQIATQFSCEGSTLSGSEFELLGSGYRVSLIKNRFVSGKYVCDAEQASRPPGSMEVSQIQV